MQEDLFLNRNAVHEHEDNLEFGRIRDPCTAGRGPIVLGRIVLGYSAIGSSSNTCSRGAAAIGSELARARGLATSRPREANRRIARCANKFSIDGTCGARITSGDGGCGRSVHAGTGAVQLTINFRGSRTIEAGDIGKSVALNSYGVGHA
jgi:hypothetical protein